MGRDAVNARRLEKKINGVVDQFAL